MERAKPRPETPMEAAARELAEMRASLDALKRDSPLSNHEPGPDERGPGSRIWDIVAAIITAAVFCAIGYAVWRWYL